MPQPYVSSVHNSPGFNESSSHFSRTASTQMSSPLRYSKSPHTTSRVAMYENAKPKNTYEYECGYLRRPLTSLSQPAYHLSPTTEPFDVKELAESHTSFKTIAESKAQIYNENYYYRKGAKGSSDHRPYYAYYTPKDFSANGANKSNNHNLDQPLNTGEDKWGIEGIRTRYQSYSTLRHTKVYRTYYSPRINGMDYHEHMFGLGKPWVHYASPIAASLYNYKPQYESDYTRPRHVEIVGKSKEIEDLDKIWMVAKGEEIGSWDKSTAHNSGRTIEILDGRKRRELEMDRMKKLYDPVEN